jgi:ribonuclease BN (tRNA processing enzyme)
LGGPLPSATRSQPANALIVRDRVYVVDAGDGAVRQLRAAGIDLRQLKQIFITHDHDDHNAGWGSILGVQWDLGIWPVDVYAPSTQSMMKGFLQYFAANARIRQADSKSGKLPPEKAFRAHDIQGNGPVFKDEWITVTAQENCHYKTDPDADMKRNDQDRTGPMRCAFRRRTRPSCSAETPATARR